MHSCLFLALSVSLNKKLTSAVLAQMSPEPLAEKTELMMCLRQTVSQYVYFSSSAAAADICSQRNFWLFLSLAGSTNGQKLSPQVHAALA